MADETKTKTVIITLDASGFTKATRAAKGDAELLTQQLKIVESTLTQFQKVVAQAGDQRLSGAFNRLTNSVTELGYAIANAGGDTKALKDLNPQIDSLTRRFASFQTQLQRVDSQMADTNAIQKLVNVFNSLVDTLKGVIAAVNNAPQGFIAFVNSISTGIQALALFTKNLESLRAGLTYVVGYFIKNAPQLTGALIDSIKEKGIIQTFEEAFSILSSLTKKFFSNFIDPAVLNQMTATWSAWGKGLIDITKSIFNTDIFKSLIDSSKLALTSLSATFNISIETIKQTFIKGLSSLPENFSIAFDSIKQIVGELSGFIGRQFNNLFGKTKIVEDTKKIFTEVSDVVAESFKGDTLIDKVKNTLSGLGDLFKKFLSDEGGFINIFNWGNEEKKAESAQSKIQKSIESTARYIKALQDTTAQGPGDKRSWFEEMLFKSRVLLADFTNYVSIIFNNLSKSIMDLFKRDSWFGEMVFKGRVLFADFSNYVTITFNNMVASVKESLGKANWFQDLVFKAKVQFYEMYNFITITLKNAFNYIKEVFSDPNWLKDFIFKAKVVFYDVYNFVTITLKNAFTYIKDVFSNAEWLKDFIFKAKVVFFDVYNYVTITFNNIAKYIKNTFGNTEWMAGFLNNVKTGFSSFLSTITSALNTAKNFLAQVLQNPRFLTDFVQNVKTGFETTMILLRAFGLTFMTIFNTIKPQVAEAAASIKDFVVNSEGFKFIKDNVSGIIERFSDLGLVFKVVAILMINYLQDIADKIYTTFKTLAENARASVKAFDILRTTVEAGLGAGKVEEFSETIDKVGKQFNFTTDDVTKATQAIAIFGNEIGLTSDEMQQLVTAAAAYSRTSGKDIATTAQDLAQALSGNVKSLKDYSIVIKDATLQQQGFLAAGQKFTDLDAAAQKVLVFNKIMAGLPEATAIAEAGINSTAGAADRLAVTIKNVEGKIGEGALAFTNSSVAAETLNSILQSLNSSFLQAFGYIGALTSKVTSLTLSFVKWGLILGAIQGTLVGLSNFMKSESFIAKLVLDTNIPIVDASLRTLIGKLVGGELVIKTFNDTIRTTGLVLKNMAIQLSIAIFNVNIFELSLAEAAGVMWSSFVTGVNAATTAVINFTTSLLANPIVATIAAIVAVFYLLYKAISFIEEQTGVFSTLWKALSAGVEPLSALKDQFVFFYEFLRDTFFGFLGVFLSAFTFLIQKALELASQMPFISKESKKAFADAAKTLDDFRTKLKDKNYNIAAMGPTPEELKKQKDAADKLATSIAKAATEAKKLKDFALSSRIKLIDESTAKTVRDLEDSFKKGEISYGRFVASVEQANLGGKLKKELISLEKLKIGGNIDTKEFEERLGNINIKMRELGVAARENDLKKQFEEGKLGLREFNDELIKIEESKVYIEIEKINKAFNEGKIIRDQFLLQLKFARADLIALSAEAQRNKLKESFYNASITLEELQEGFTKIELNKQFLEQLNTLEIKLKAGKLSPEQFAADSEKIREQIRKTSLEQEIADKKRSDREALAKARLQFGAGSVGEAQEKRKQAQEGAAGLLKKAGEEDPITGFLAGIEKVKAEVPTIAESFASVGEAAFNGLTDSMMNFIETGKFEFGAFFKDLGMMIAKIGIQKLAIYAVDLAMKAIGITPVAKGGVFENGQMTAFARGGIVSKPTIFPMANGAGLMGEAGPEAIMPLTRNTKGRLGVDANGMGGNTTIVNIYNQTKDSEVETKETTDPNGMKKIDVFISQKIRGAFQSGEMDRTMQTSFGLSRVGSR